MPESFVPENLVAWIENSLEQGRNVLATSNQGTVLHYRDGEREFLVKAAMGSGAVRRARQATLEREYEAYKRLQGLGGVPQCYGLLDGRYLLLEYIRGVEYRDADWKNRAEWFRQLLDIIRGFHERGVAHGDLKSKGNLIDTEDHQPCVIDFGTTVLFKPGFHPVNNFMFRYLKRLDINAWVKHKYHGRYEDASEEDRALLNYSWLESLLRRYRKWRDGA